MAEPCLVPCLVLSDPEAAAAFLCTAFGAERVPAASRAVELRLGGVRLALLGAQRGHGMLGSESYGGAAVFFRLAVADLDAALARAQGAGAVLLQPPLPTGSAQAPRAAVLRDPALHLWHLVELVGS